MEKGVNGTEVKLIWLDLGWGSNCSVNIVITFGWAFWLNQQSISASQRFVIVRQLVWDEGGDRMINKREINWNGNEGVNSLFNEWPFFSSHRKRDLLSLLFWLGLSSLVCQTLTIRRIRERRRSASLSPPHVDTISTPLSHWLGCGFPCCYHLCVYGRRWSRPKCGFLTNKFIGVGQF